MKSLSQKFQQNIIEKNFYSEPFIKKEKPKAEDFFKAITYQVDLQGLYRIKKTCFYHFNFEYCPVVIEVVDQEMKEKLGANFLLQVWNKDCQKVYEKALKYDVPSWNCFYDYLVFGLDPNEEGSEFTYVVEFKKDCATYKIKNLAGNDRSYVHYGVLNKWLYVANSNFIKITVIEGEVENGAEIEIERAQNQIRTHEIKEPCKIHGFIENKHSKAGNYLVTLVETEDNQIDFARIYIRDNNVMEGEIYFLQYSEVVFRETKFDPIKKIKLLFLTTEFLHGLAIRESGQVDIYWNCKRVNSSEECFDDIDINFDKYFIQRRDESILTIDTKWHTRVGIEVAEETELTIEDLHESHYKRINNHVKIYQSFALINISFFVAHGNYISLYDIIEKKWKKTFHFEEKVLNVFRNEKNDTAYNIGLYLANNRVKVIDTEDPTNTDQWQIKDMTQVTKGKSLQFVSEKEHYRMTYVLNDDNGTINLYGFARETLFILNSLVHDLKPTTRVLPFFSPDPRSQFILYNGDTGDIRIYEHYWANNKDNKLTFYLRTIKELKLNNPKDIDSTTLHTAFSTNYAENVMMVDNNHIYYFNVVTKAVKKYSDQTISGLHFLDNRYLYALINKSTKSQSGFYMYDLQNMLENDSDTRYFLDEAMVGQNNIVDFSADNQRICYMNDYEKISIVPALHRNVINFMGMDTRDQYLCNKKIKNLFVALDKRNYLYTWNILTGKLIHKHRVEGIDLSGYEIYSYEDLDVTYRREWFQPKTLIREIKALEGYNDDKFFDEDLLRQTFTGNKVYTRIVAKTFHTFTIIEILNEREIKVHFSFPHVFYGKGKYQRLYIADDMEHILERLVNQRVFLYKKRVDENGNVTFPLCKRIQNFPMDLSELTYANYLFSKNLMSYMDYDRSNNQFVVKDTISQNIVYTIPQSLMDPRLEDPKEIVKRFMWIDDNTIRLVNIEGFEKIIDLQNDYQQLAIAAVPLFNITKNYKHYYFHRESLKLGDVYQRLVKKYQQHKAITLLQGKEEPHQIYDELFDIEYNIDNAKYKFVAEHSFTYLHWRMIDIMKNDKDFNLNQIDDSQIQQLVVNILPQGNTVLHYVIEKSQLLRGIYKTSTQKGSEFEIPFILNFEKKSPISLCFDLKEYKNVEFLLSQLKDQPVDHHSRALTDAIPLAIAYGFSEVGPYMDSRFVQTEQIKKIKRGFIKKNPNLDYAVQTGEYWDDTNQIYNRVFIDSPVEQDVILQLLDLYQLHSYESTISDAFFDSLAEIEDFSIFQHKSVQTLIDYKWGQVRKYTERYLFVPFVCYLFMYLIYSFFIFENVWDYNSSSGSSDNSTDTTTDSISQGWYIFDVIISCSIPVFSLYFIISECKQLQESGLSYFFSIWNYLDFLPPILNTYLVIVTSLLGHDHNYIRTFYAVSSLLMWLKLLYFLRIYKETGYLVRMIIQVIYDMRIFLLVLFFVICGFANAFLAISSGSETDFVGGGFIAALIYTYNTNLGDFNYDDFNDSVQPVTVWILFVLTTLLTMIIMFNLLIAIISETFSQFNANYVLAGNQERARIISENSYLIPKSVKDEYKVQDSRFILVAKEEQDDNKEEDLHTHISELQKDVKEYQEKNEKKLKEIIELLEKK